MKSRRVGKEIMGLAVFIRVFITILFSLVGLILFSYGLQESEDVLCLVGALVIIIGIIFGWVVTLLLYGYGELIDQTMHTHYAVRDLQNMLYTQLEKTNSLIDSESLILESIADKFTVNIIPDVEDKFE